MPLSKIAEEISQSTTIGISYHTSPDGDSLGSALALLLALKKLNKDAYILSKETPPKDFGFLPLIREITSESSLPSTATDLIIILDCGNKDRINANLNNYKGKIINIDHHVTNEFYGDINHVDTSAAAVGEIVFDVINCLNIEITQDIAICLYTSLLTDTGSFKYSSTTEKTHNIAGALISTGFDFTEVHRLIYDNKDYKYLKLQGKVFDTMYLSHKGTICIMEIKEELLRDLDYELEDSSEIIASALKIKGIEVAVLFREKSGGIKISLRSKDKIDVRKIAEHFSGGGHVKAAGIFLPNVTLEAAKECILKKIKEEI